MGGPESTQTNLGGRLVAIYEYRCLVCEHITVMERKHKERHDPVVCEECESETELTIPKEGGFVLAGGCWGKDGYRKS